jgi:hypothetical protein
VSPAKEPSPGKKPGPVSRVYEAIGIDDEGDARVRRLVRRSIEQVVRFVTHYAEALKREGRREEGAPRSESQRQKPGRHD